MANLFDTWAKITNTASLKEFQISFSIHEVQ